MEPSPSENVTRRFITVFIRASHRTESRRCSTPFNSTPQLPVLIHPEDKFKGLGGKPDVELAYIDLVHIIHCFLLVNPLNPSGYNMYHPL
jgi:hypothetical protein